MVISKYLMLVEGSDDQHVVRNILVQHGVSSAIPGRDKVTTPDTVAIREKEGFENLRADLDVELDNPTLERLGIVVDADVDLGARWQSLRHRLEELGAEDVPDGPNPRGTIITVVRPDRVRIVGVWIMPNNTMPGILEHFIESLIPPVDVLWPRAKLCVEQIPEHERRFREHQKASIHTWLAWQEHPGRPLGVAITARYLDTQAAPARSLVDWVRRLFEV